ncbi:MAG: methyl-accepting chemotaxis protein [Amphritea sp.]|nr:methyl-accepting chemotaxis protein [Amphritea sp.]
MFFSGKLHQKIDDLEAEVERLKSENLMLMNENQDLNQRIYDQKHIAADAAELSQREICTAWVQGGGLVANVRETLANAAQSLREEKHSLSDSLGIFDETRQAVEVILDRVQVIQGRAQSGNTNVQSLLAVSDEIEKFVGVIRDISDQTNLLALNAAIEAARAGESGRGFAVVADEVRNLARKASEASDEIATLVGQISDQTHVASDDIGQVDILSSEVVSSAEQIKAGVSQVVDLSQRMSDVISGSASDAFIETVKLDHINWKNTVYEAIVSSQLDNFVGLADHTSCRLGNWYYTGEGQQLYRHLNSFKLLEAPHEQVHSSGLAAVEAAREGDLKHAAACLATMEKASMEVGRLLDNLNSELQTVVA